MFEESITARAETYRFSSEVQDLRSEFEDLQRQHEEALHDISNHQTEVSTFNKVFKIIFIQFYV